MLTDQICSGPRTGGSYGRNGGGAELTQMGEKVVSFYRSAERKVQKSAGREIKGIEAALAD
jgi:molybdate transport repressor ModE-like protein